MTETVQDIAEEQIPKKVTHNITSLNKRLEQIELLLSDPSNFINFDEIKELVAEKIDLKSGNNNSDLGLGLFERIQALENCIAKMAHYNGGANERILREFGIEPYTLKATDMSKVG